MTDHSFLRSFRSLAEMVRPPFDGLWLLVTLYYAWAFFVYPHAPILRGDFPDTDNYMYLTQIIDWMRGQGWYDNAQHRLDPPNGVSIHFSRLAMMPMAGMMLAFQFLGLGPKGSAMLMAVFYPLFLLGGFFVVVRWAAQSFMPKEWAGVTAFVGLFATFPLYQFMPGRVDHHSLIIILVAATLGCAARMMQSPERRRWPAYAGLLLALGMVVALETLPWLLVVSAYLGFWAIIKGGNAARGGLLYGLALLGGSALGLALTRPPAEFLTFDVLTYSSVYVILPAAMVVAFASVVLAAKAPVALRLLVGGGLAVGLGALFLHRFPELIAGPYGGIDPALSRIILDEINEAQPIKMAGVSWLSIFWIMGSTLVAVPVGLYVFAKSTGAQRWLWGLLMLLTVAAVGLTLFYQRRFNGAMGMLQIIPLAVLLQRGWGWIGAHWRGRQQFFAELALLLLVGPFPAVLFPALADGRSFNLGVLLFPVSVPPESQSCNMYDLESVLRDPRGLGSRPRLIMNTIGSGPELLFRTNHRVLAAPYHMDVQGNVDSSRFFSTPYPDEAEAIARRRGVELVITCKFAERFYFRPSALGRFAAGEDVKGDFAPHFVERLLEGHIPAWLKPVKAPGVANYVLYEVLPPAAEAKP